MSGHNRELNIVQDIQDVIQNKNFKRSALVLGSILAFGSGVSAQETPPPQETLDPNVRYETEVTGSRVNLRSQPRANGSYIQTIERGTRLEVSLTGITTPDGHEWVQVWEINDVPVQDTTYASRTYLGLLSEIENEEAPAVAAPEAPEEIPTVNATEAPISSGVFAVPQEATPQLENYTADRTPEAITTSEDWTFDAQSMSYVTTTPEGEVHHYRWYMGNTPEEDEEFGSQFVERDALEQIDENGNIVFRMSIETSNLDPNLENIEFNPNLAELYGMTESEYTQAFKDVLYRNYPFLEEAEVNDIRIVYRTGVTYTNEGNESDEGDSTRNTEIPGYGFFNTYLNVHSNTLVIYVGADSGVTPDNQQDRFYSIPFAAMNFGLIYRQAEIDDVSLVGVDVAAPMRETLREILTIGDNNQFENIPENIDNLLRIDLSR